jgi:hypothetical protein
MNKFDSFITSESRTAKSEFKDYLESHTKDDLINYYKSIGYKMSSSKTKQDLVDYFVKEFVKSRENIKNISSKTKKYDLRVPKKIIEDVTYTEEFTMFSSLLNGISMKFPKVYTQQLSQIYSIKYKTYPELINTGSHLKSEYPFNIENILYFEKTDDGDGWYIDYDITMIAHLKNNCYVLHAVTQANEYVDIEENNVYVFKTYEELIDALPVDLYNDFRKNTVPS